MSTKRKVETNNLPANKNQKTIPPENPIEIYKISPWFHNCGVNALVPHLIQFLAPSAAEYSSFQEEFPTSNQINQFKRLAGYQLFKETFLEYYNINDIKYNFDKNLNNLLSQFSSNLDQTLILGPALRTMLAKVLLQNKTYKENYWHNYISLINKLHNECIKFNLKAEQIHLFKVEDIYQDLFNSNKQYIINIINLCLEKDIPPNEIIGITKPNYHYQPTWDTIYNNYCNYVGSIKHHPFLFKEQIEILANTFKISVSFEKESESNQQTPKESNIKNPLKNITLINKNNTHWDLKKISESSYWDSSEVTENTAFHGVFEVSQSRNYTNCENILNILKQAVVNAFKNNMPYYDEYLYPLTTNAFGSDSVLEGLNKKIIDIIKSRGKNNPLLKTKGFENFITSFKSYYDINLPEKDNHKLLEKLNLLFSRYPHPIDQNLILFPITIPLLEQQLSQTLTEQQIFLNAAQNLYENFKLKLKIYNENLYDGEKILNQDLEEKDKKFIDTIHMAYDGYNWNILTSNLVKALQYNLIMQDKKHLHLGNSPDLKSIKANFNSIKIGISKYLNDGPLYHDNKNLNIPCSNEYKTPNVYNGISDEILTYINTENIPELTKQTNLVNLKCINNNNLLHIAAAYNKVDIVKYCVDILKINMETNNNNHETPLLVAAKHGATNVVTYLLNHGASPNCYDKNHFNLCHAFAIHGDIKNLKIALKKSTALYESKNFWQKLKSSNLNLKHSTIFNRSQPFKNKKWGEYKNWDPIHFAVFFGHLNFAQYLVDNGANLHSNGWYKNFKKLKSHNIIPTNPLTLATITGNIIMIDAILKWQEQRKNLTECEYEYHIASQRKNAFKYALNSKNLNAIHILLPYQDTQFSYPVEFGIFIKHPNLALFKEISSNNGIRYILKPNHHGENILHQLAAMTQSSTRDALTDMVMAKLCEARTTNKNGHFSIWLKNNNKNIIDIALEHENENWLTKINTHLESPIREKNKKTNHSVIESYNEDILCFCTILSKKIIQFIKKEDQDNIVNLIKINLNIGYLSGKYNIFHYANKNNKLPLLLKAYAKATNNDNNIEIQRQIISWFDKAKDDIGRPLAYYLSDHPRFGDICRLHLSSPNFWGRMVNRIQDLFNRNTIVEQDTQHTIVNNLAIVIKPLFSLSYKLSKMTPYQAGISIGFEILKEKVGLNLRNFAGNTVASGIGAAGNIASNYIPNVPHIIDNYLSETITGKRSHRFKGMGTSIIEGGKFTARTLICYGMSIDSLCNDPLNTAKNYMINTAINNCAYHAFPNSPNAQATIKIFGGAMIPSNGEPIVKDDQFYGKIEYNLNKLFSHHKASKTISILKAIDQITEYANKNKERAYTWLTDKVPTQLFSITTEYLTNHTKNIPKLINIDNNFLADLFEKTGDIYQSIKDNTRSASKYLNYLTQEFDAKIKDAIERGILNQMDQKSDFVQYSYARMAHDHLTRLIILDASADVIEDASNTFNSFYNNTEASIACNEWQEVNTTLLNCKAELAALKNEKKPNRKVINQKQLELDSLIQQELQAFNTAQLMNYQPIAESIKLSRQINNKRCEDGIGNMLNYQNYHTFITNISKDALIQGNNNHAEIANKITDEAMKFIDPFNNLNENQFFKKREELYSKVLTIVDLYVGRKDRFYHKAGHYEREFHRAIAIDVYEFMHHGAQYKGNHSQLRKGITNTGRGIHKGILALFRAIANAMKKESKDNSSGIINNNYNINFHRSTLGGLTTYSYTVSRIPQSNNQLSTFLGPQPRYITQMLASQNSNNSLPSLTPTSNLISKNNLSNSSNNSKNLNGFSFNEAAFYDNWTAALFSQREPVPLSPGNNNLQNASNIPAENNNVEHQSDLNNVNFMHKVSFGSIRAGHSLIQGIKQFGLEIGEKIGIVDKEKVETYTKMIQEDRQLYKSTPVGKSIPAKIAETTTDFGMMIAASGGAIIVAGGRVVAGLTLSGGLSGALQPTEEGTLNSRARNFAIGASMSAVAGSIFNRAAQGFRAVFSRNRTRNTALPQRSTQEATQNKKLVQNKPNHDSHAVSNYDKISISGDKPKPIVHQFGRSSEKSANQHNRKATSEGMANAAQAEKLAKDIEKRTLQSMFSTDGKLTQGAINEAKIIMNVLEFNPKSPIYIELSKRGNIGDWGKYRTQKFVTPEISSNIASSKRNLTAEVHFYKNKKTGEVYFEKDFKVKYDLSGTPFVSTEEFLKSIPKDWRPQKP